MDVIEQGHYVLHVFFVGERAKPINDHEKRDSLSFYPRVIRYRELTTNAGRAWINELGSLIMLQRIAEANTADEAYAQYRSGTLFAAPYRQAVKAVNSLMKTRLSDSDVSLFLSVGRHYRAVEWDAIRIPVGVLREHAVALEACFIYHCLAYLSARLPSLTTRQTPERLRRGVVAFAESLARLDSARMLLVNGEEVAILDDYYEQWQLAAMVKAAREQIGAVAGAGALFFDEAERRLSGVLNIILSIVALAGLYQIRDLWTPLFPTPRLAEQSFRWVIGVATFVALGLILISAIKWTWERIRNRLSGDDLG